ncbi:hypothetical protein J5N97_009840 [Dioscorea zingiberensis]|uniref:Cytochrome P450 n=1 Tax=Dioscorea zingiberensis TaxID=325984 RepID=A0A9D5HLV8_9LILI|nr:hypothetical protein J5N97_009840 [Dioscorea zingiberensis]
MDFLPPFTFKHINSINGSKTPLASSRRPSSTTPHRTFPSPSPLPPSSPLLHPPSSTPSASLSQHHRVHSTCRQSLPHDHHRKHHRERELARAQQRARGQWQVRRANGVEIGVKAYEAFIESNGSPTETEFEIVSGVRDAYIDSLFTIEPPEIGKLGEEELVTLCSEVMSAGIDTSAMALKWVMAHLTLNQEEQEKVYREVVVRVGEAKEEEITERDVETMGYLPPSPPKQTRAMADACMITSISITVLYLLSPR